MLRRIIGVLSLDADTYEDVKHDKSALLQAVFIVAIASAAILGGELLSRHEVESPSTLAVGILVGIGFWATWVLFIKIAWGLVFAYPHSRAYWGQLLRTTGFAQAPGMLSVLSFLPTVGDLINLLVLFWILTCMVFAVRPGPDNRSTLWTMLVVLLSFMPFPFLGVIISALASGLGITFLI